MTHPKILSTTSMAVLVSVLFFTVQASSQEAPEPTDPPPLQIPLELAVGEERIQHEFFFFAPLTTDNEVSVFTLGRFAHDWDDPAQNQSLLSTQLIWNTTSWLGLATGANTSGTQVSPLLAVSLLAATSDGTAYVNLFPTLFYHPNTLPGMEQWSAELFAMAAWTPSFTETWGLFTQVMGGIGTPVSLDEHLYSYTQLRIGLDYARTWQFGFALDQELYGSGEELGYTDNIGLFVRRPIGL